MSNDPQPASALPSERRLLEPGDLVGRFQVETLLGAGGMGEVYRAWDPTLERAVALKALRTCEEREHGGPERFRREALALAQLNHPNVCQVHDWVSGPGGTYIAMELLEGQTLDLAAPELKLRDKLQVIRGVALALEAAHAKGLVHRDLKPSNIMVAPGKGGHLGPLVKVLDFGLARLTDPHVPGETQITPGPVPNLALLQALEEAERKQESEPGESTQRRSGTDRRHPSGPHSWEQLTLAGTFMGSPCYASPEQIQGQAAGPSSDVFSLGILAWELLAGEHPFPGEGKARMRAIIEGSRRELKVRGLPSGAADLLRAMLDAHPFKRPTAARVAESLGHLLRPRSVLRWAAVAVAATAALGAGANWFMSRGIIADLVRERPARLAVLPVLNHTGDNRYNGLINRALPEDTGARLAEIPRLQVIEQETLVRAARKLNLNLAGGLDPSSRRSLAKYLGAALLLHGEVVAQPSPVLRFVLEDEDGGARIRGDIPLENPLAGSLQVLPDGLAAKIRLAVDPRGNPKSAPQGRAEAEPLLAFGQGLELMGNGAYKDALPLMRAAAFQSPFSAGPVVGYATCLYRTGDASTDAALRWALATARLSKDRYREVITLKALSLREREQQHLEAAAAYGREGLSLAEQGGFEAQRVSILNNLGLVLQDQGRPDEAHACFSRAAEVQRKLPDPQGLANSINNLAILARKRGAFQEAEANYREALTLHQTQKNRFGEALALTNLGDLCLSLRRFKEANEHLTKADALYEEAGNRTERAMCKINLGMLRQSLGDFSGSEAAFQQARNLAEETQALPSEALAWFYLGGLSRQQGRLAEAAARYTQATKRFQELGGGPEIGECQAGLAECALQRPAPSLREADRLIQEAAKACKPASPFLLRAQWRRAQLAGQNDLAAQLLEQVLTASKQEEPEIYMELEPHRSKSRP